MRSRVKRIAHTSRAAIAICVGIALPILCGWGLLLDLLLSDFQPMAPTGDDGLDAVIVLGVVIIWFLLAVLLIVCAINGAMPWPSAAAALILLPVSAVTAFGCSVAVRETEFRSMPVRLMIVTPALVPPIIVAFAFWVLLPTLRTAIPARFAAGGAWGVVFVSCVFSWWLLAR